MLPTFALIALAAGRLAARAKPDEYDRLVHAAATVEVLRNRLGRDRATVLLAESPVAEDTAKLEQDLDALTEKLGEQDAGLVHDDQSKNAPTHGAKAEGGEAGSDEELIHHGTEVTEGDSHEGSPPPIDEEGYKEDWHTEHKDGEYPAHPMATPRPKPKEVDDSLMGKR